MVGISKNVGAPIKRKEDPRLITGEGKYTDDVYLRGMVHMAVLRSPHAHARIVGLDTSKAEADPQVLAVLTGPEVEKRCASKLPLTSVKEGMKTRSRYPLVTDVTRYVGEAVVAVTATSRGAAANALELIEVEYEPLPVVMDMEKAATPGSPLVHEDMGTNVCVESSGEAGDTDGAFGEADEVVSLRLAQPRVVVNPMEPRAAVASYERSTRSLTLWDTTQAPHKVRGEMADVLGLPENKIRVIAIDVGGGFGVKHPTYPESYLTAMMAMQLRRPVKWVEDRGEHFLSSDHGRGEVQYVDAAYRNDGTLLAMRLRYHTDLGAYSHGTSHSVASALTPLGAPGAYGVRNLSWTSVAVYTNKVPVGPYRGYGRHQASYVTERVMDSIALQLNMDPAEVRRRNYIPKDAFPYRTPTGLEYDSGDYSGALELALETAGYSQLREEQSRLRAQGSLMGIGIATSVDMSGFGPSGSTSSSSTYESATVRLDPSGRVTVLTGSSPHGQGLQTTLAQIAADELQVPFDNVEVIHGDTSIVPKGGGTAASRSLVVGGGAVHSACGKVREKAIEIAAALLQIDSRHVVLEGGRFYAEDIPEGHLSWEDVAVEAHEVRYIPRDMERGLEATSFWEPPDYTFPYSVNVVVVDIDRETGDVKLVKCVAVDDCGTVVNPLVVEGQAHGGLAQGIGIALLEEAKWDEAGQLVTGSFMDYAMPFAHELPAFILAQTVTPSPHNPMGAKGGGEMGTTVVAPAIANAVVDALSHLGVTEISIPVTSEKVWRILCEKGTTG